MNSTNYNEDEAVLAVLDHKRTTSSISVLNAAIPVSITSESRKVSSETN